MVPIHDLGQSNLSDLLGLPHLFQVIDHSNIVGVVDALHGIYHPADSIFL